MSDKEQPTEYSDFPEAKWMNAGNQFLNVTLRWSNGTTSSDRYRKTENIEEVLEAVKNYESKRQKACFHTNPLESEVVCEGLFSLNNCECLKDAYKEMMSYLQPYKRYVVEGLLERDNQGNYFLGGYNTPIPEEMANLIVEHYEDDLSIDHLVEFWKKLLLNPNEQAREDLFDYISDHGITITDNGYMVLYKAVTTKNKAVPDDDLAEFVGGEYIKRKSWGKNPADYYVYDLDEEVTLPNNHTADPGLYVSTMENILVTDGYEEFSKEVEPLGNLADLHDDVDKLSRESETVYTDKRTRTFEYNLGEAHSEPREECDPDPSNSCSNGLHVGSYDYVSRFGRSSDTIQAVLVNPMHVVALPNHDNSKIRTCEFFSYGIMEKDEDGVWHELETQYFEEDYEAHEEDALEERLEELNTSNPLEESNTEGDQLKAAQDRLIDLRDN